MTEPAYARVMLKVSGEALMGDSPFGIEMKTIERIAKEIGAVAAKGIEVCLVIGGGNIFRGLTGAAQGMDRARADYMGMLATVMNALAMNSAFEKLDVPARVLSAIPMPTVCEPFARERAVRHLNRGRVVIFAAGTGNPFFTTDTAASLRAAEMGCNALMKGTSVDGIYSDDPKLNPDAQRFETLSHQDILSKDLKVMDAAAVTLARENNIPIVVFSIKDPGAIVDVLQGRGKFTKVQ